VQDEYNSKSSGIRELTTALQQVSDELAGIKGRMDERGSNMTDTTPLIKIKSALQRIKEERKAMDGARHERRRCAAASPADLLRSLSAACGTRCAQVQRRVRWLVCVCRRLLRVLTVRSTHRGRDAHARRQEAQGGPAYEEGGGHAQECARAEGERF
jgi:hypothetical protein